MVATPNSLDIRPLNEVPKDMGWILLNIDLMLHRLGSAKAKYFAVVHQTSLAKGAKTFTELTNPLGLYEWSRVPMGLKSATSFSINK